jgi:excinuclease UvrABC helicase subunit UvrB
MLFKNFHNLNRLFKELDSFDEFLFSNHTTNKTGNDENGEWERKTYKSSDGLISYSFFTKKYKPNGDDEITSLKRELETTVKNQDFERSCELRDKIKKLEENKTELETLNKKLSECVKNQDYEEAIKLRDKIKELK